MRALVKEAWGGEAHGPKTLTLTAGLPVELIEVNGDWSYISVNGQKGFAPTAVLSDLEGRKLEQTVARTTAASASALGKGFVAVCVIAYEAELAEGLSLQANAELRVIQPGEEWSFCEYREQRGFVPTALLRVSAEPLLDFCQRTGVEVTPANYTTSDSSMGSEAGDSLKKPYVPGAGVGKEKLTQGQVEEAVQKDASVAIAAHVWKSLSDAEKHRQQMIYGIVHSEFLFNKNMWALSSIGRDFASLNAAHPMLSADERDALFQDVDSLFSASTTFFQQLVRRVKSSRDGVVDSIADVIESNLPAFDVYLKYCSKDRRSVQQQIFFEYRSLFGHPFHKFLEKLSQQVDLQQLVNKPAQNIALWPFLVKNLLKDTSKLKQAIEYRTLRSIQAVLAGINGQLQHVAGAAAFDLHRRIVNYAKLEPHVRGRKLLKESPAKIVSGSGGDLGNQAFLFDSCLVFARRQKQEEADQKKEPVFRAVKKVKLVGLRIADVQRSTVILRSEGDKYYLTLPSMTAAIDWRNIISHKNYRERMDFSDGESDEGTAAAALPATQPEYDAHLARVERMQGFISALLGPNAPALAPLAAGPETLKLRAGAGERAEKKKEPVAAVRVIDAKPVTAAATKSTSSPRAVAAPAATPAAAAAASSGKGKQEEHEYTDSDDDQEEEATPARKSPKTPINPAQRAIHSEDRTASAILRDAIRTPARQSSMGSTNPVMQSVNRSSEYEDEEERSSEFESSSVNNPSPQKPVVANVVLPQKAVTKPSSGDYTEEEEMEEEGEFTTESTEENRKPAPASAVKVGSLPPKAPSATPVTTASTPIVKKAITAAAEESDSSDYVSSSSEKPKSATRTQTPSSTNSSKGPGPSSMYRSLTGQLDNIIAKSTGGTRQGSEDESEDEFETEYSSEPATPVRTGTVAPRPAATPVAKPAVAQFSNSPDESPARSGTASATASGKVTARGAGAKSESASDEDEYEEYEEEGSYSSTA